jgi:hypothetical protein
VDEPPPAPPTLWDRATILAIGGLGLGGMVLMCIIVLVLIWLR